MIYECIRKYQYVTSIYSGKLTRSYVPAIISYVVHFKPVFSAAALTRRPFLGCLFAWLGQKIIFRIGNQTLQQPAVKASTVQVPQHYFMDCMIRIQMC